MGDAHDVKAALEKITGRRRPMQAASERISGTSMMFPIEEVRRLARVDQSTGRLRVAWYLVYWWCGTIYAGTFRVQCLCAVVSATNVFVTLVGAITCGEDCDREALQRLGRVLA